MWNLQTYLEFCFHGSSWQEKTDKNVKENYKDTVVSRQLERNVVKFQFTDRNPHSRVKREFKISFLS